MAGHLRHRALDGRSGRGCLGVGDRALGGAVRLGDLGHDLGSSVG